LGAFQIVAKTITFVKKQHTSMAQEGYLVLAAERYEVLEQLKEKANFYDYEKGVDAIWTDLGRMPGFAESKRMLVLLIKGTPKNPKSLSIKLYQFDLQVIE
jgi:hypothetical protein